VVVVVVVEDWDWDLEGEEVELFLGEDMVIGKSQGCVSYVFILLLDAWRTARSLPGWVFARWSG
jgi:hypothetical protein